jgi:two-component system CheB/CheR fusion protein
MPRNAIQSGAIDFVLPPDEIIDTLIRISNHSLVDEIEKESKLSSEDSKYFEKILNLLLTNTGVDFSEYRSSTILRRI